MNGEREIPHEPDRLQQQHPHAAASQNGKGHLLRGGKRPKQGKSDAQVLQNLQGVHGRSKGLLHVLPSGTLAHREKHNATTTHC